MPKREGKPTPSEKRGDRRQPAGRRTRKAYEAPAWEVEEVFEKAALACGKVASDQDGCFGNLSS